MAPTPAQLQSVTASQRVHDLLVKLHAESAAQENSISQIFFYISRIALHYLHKNPWGPSADDHMRDKFVSLEEDKCQFMYLLARTTGARNIIEAGTSFGVSTIYLALAVGQNVAGAKADGQITTGKVIATETEPTKAERAKKHWEQAGEEVEPWIELRVGDLLETLKVEEGMPDNIDMLLLDIWTPLALPTLELVRPRLKRGALILADNTVMAKSLYKEFMAYVYDAKNGFKTTTVPYSGGLQVIMYLPDE